jgi:hypothetical protein
VNYDQLWFGGIDVCRAAWGEFLSGLSPAEGFLGTTHFTDTATANHLTVRAKNRQRKALHWDLNVTDISEFPVYSLPSITRSGIMHVHLII